MWTAFTLPRKNLYVHKGRNFEKKVSCCILLKVQLGI
jgi:hypothetical protein